MKGKYAGIGSILLLTVLLASSVMPVMAKGQNIVFQGIAKGSCFTTGYPIPAQESDFILVGKGGEWQESTIHVSKVSASWTRNDHFLGEVKYELDMILEKIEIKYVPFGAHWTGLHSNVLEVDGVLKVTKVDENITFEIDLKDLKVHPTSALYMYTYSKAEDIIDLSINWGYPGSPYTNNYYHYPCPNPNHYEGHDYYIGIRFIWADYLGSKPCQVQVNLTNS